MGFPIRELTARSGLRNLTVTYRVQTPFIDFLCQGIHCLPLVAFYCPVPAGINPLQFIWNWTLIVFLKTPFSTLSDVIHLSAYNTYEMSVQCRLVARATVYHVEQKN